MSKQTDIAVIGAGMVGLSLTHLLAPAIKQGLSVTLIERHAVEAKNSDIPSFDGRGTAISYGSQQILQKIDVWKHLSRACPIEHISVTDQGHIGQMNMHASEMDCPALGYIVENAQLGEGLLQNIPEHQLLDDTEVLAIKPCATGMQLSFQDKPELNAKLVILADGNRSGLASQLGIVHEKQSYGQQALVTRIHTDAAHQNWAYERFCQQGPVAFLPLGEQDFMVVWSIDNAQVQAMMKLPDEDFLALLKDKIGDRLGEFLSVGECHHYPLTLSLAKEQIRSRLVLLGNSAHALHPVAGQGFNLALRDTVNLSNKLNQAYLQEQDLGSFSLLESYLKEQAFDQKSITTASDLLPKLFTHSNPMVAYGRNMGLLAMNFMPHTRKAFTKYAMGLAQSKARMQQGVRG